MFFNKFWETYRDTANFTSFNFFHNSIWVKLGRIFIDLSHFFIELLRIVDNRDLGMKLQKYLFDFKLAISHSNQHTIQFQNYVILECLGNYNRLLYYKDHPQIDQKKDVFFVMSYLF